jgi:hypothetical protein
MFAPLAVTAIRELWRRSSGHSWTEEHQNSGADSTPTGLITFATGARSAAASKRAQATIRCSDRHPLLKAIWQQAKILVKRNNFLHAHAYQIRARIELASQENDRFLLHSQNRFKAETTLTRPAPLRKRETKEIRVPTGCRSTISIFGQT